MAAEAQKTKTNGVPGKRAIQAQLGRITASVDFDTSQRSVGFLRFVVEETLARRENVISQQAIAGHVFGRGDEFDASTDPIVRMQAGRVRRSLKHYYLTAGAADTLLIEMPKGSYVPTFSFREPAASVPQPAAAPAIAATDSWPTILTSPLRNLTGRQDVEFIAQGLASDLAAELSRDKAVHVFLSPRPNADPNRPCQARFELAGTVALRGDDFRINLHLIDRSTGQQNWAQAYSCPAGSDRGVALDKVVQTTVAMITEERGILSQHFRRESRQRRYANSSAYEAILRHHHFDLTHEPQAFVEALGALRRAVESDPDCALCCTYLARLGGIHWSLGVPGDVIPIEDSIAAARRGAQLAPRDVRSRAVLAYVLLIADETEEARSEADIALQLSSMSTFWIDAVGYLLTLSGDWKRGPELIRRAFQINPFPRRSCHDALWLDAIRRGDTTAALAEAQEHAPESYFWSPLMQAVSLVAADRVDEAALQVDKVLEIKSDFAERGHWLITRYVKFEPLVREIEEALVKAGLRMA